MGCYSIKPSDNLRVRINLFAVTPSLVKVQYLDYPASTKRKLWRTR